MKKTNISKLASVVLLSQLFLVTPVQVLANEQEATPIKQESPTKQEEQKPATSSSSEATEESTATTESSTKPSNSSSAESSTTSSSSGNTESASTSSSTTESSQSTPDQPVKPAEPAKQPNPSNAQQVTPPPAIPVQAVQETPAPQAPATQTETWALHEQVPASTSTQDGAIHFQKDESVDSFIRKIGESARKIGKEKDLYASVMIAQAILESASGQSKLAQAPNYNLFGIKGTHNGKTVSMATQEDLGNGAMYTTQSGFRVYENYEDSFNDYATLLKEGLIGNTHFYDGVWKSNAKTYQEATKFLTGRYATDTQYNKKLNGLIETYHLDDYDKEVQGASISATGYKVPVEHYTISSPFGNRGAEFHRGLDLAAAQGEPIHASKAGIVLKAEFHSSWGNHVVIEHADGMTTLYAHQAEYVVKAGDKVEQGQVIGYVGSTGNSTGSHLHMEVCKDGSLSQGMLLDPQHVLFGN